MERIDRISKIDKSELSGEHYLKSLLEQAYLCGLLSDSDLEKIQLDCLSILARQTERYHHGESSSIRIEAAESMLTSILFTIGIYLKAYENPDDAAAVLRRENMETLFEEGRRQVDKMVNTAKALHSRIVQNLIDTPNVFYRSAVVDAIGGFFQLYDPDFGAHEIHITADYPTCSGVSDLAGIEFIWRYLENIACENEFCAYFPAENTHHLLCGYHEDYPELLFNLYEPVLTAALGCMLAGKEIYSLELSSDDIAYLGNLFENRDRDAIEAALRNVLNQVKHVLFLPDDLMEYLKGSLPQIAAAIGNAVRTDTVDRVFAVPRYPEREAVIAFSYGEKMDNEQYRKLAEEIMQCRRTEDKIVMIKEKVRSFADFSDILLDAEFSPGEISEILKLLNPGELAALIKKYPYQSALELFDLRESEKRLCVCLKQLVDSLTKEQQNCLEAAVAHLKEE